MRTFPTIISAVFLGFIILVTVVWPLFYLNNTDAEMPDLSSGGNDIMWYCPVFDDEGVVCDHVLSHTPTGISEEEYIAAFNDTDMPRENLIGYGMFVPECPPVLIGNLSRSVKEAGGDMGTYTEREICITIAAFVVNGIYYIEDNRLYGCSEYASTPAETLFLRRGDCEDVSILYVSVARAYGIDSALIDLHEHCMAGVRIDGYKGIVDGYTPVECTHTFYPISRLYMDCDSEPLRAYDEHSLSDRIARSWMRICNKTSEFNPTFYLLRMLS